MGAGHKSISDTLKEIIEPLAVSGATGVGVATILDSAVHFIIQLIFAIITAAVVFFFNRFLKHKFDKPKEKTVKKYEEEYN